MIIITRRKIVIMLLFIGLFVISARHPSQKSAEVFSGEITKCIVLDAGHGFPDGGAVGATGTIECTLNIEIAKQIEKLLLKKGYTVIMTRTGENSLSAEGGTIAERKKADMYNRLEIINDANADMFVSIHMNKYKDSRYKGAQVIYSGNFAQSQTIAQYIQQELHKLADNETKRSVLEAPSSIFLLKKSSIPAVIVECGFLSNFEEEELLGNKKYQKEISLAIVKGIEKYYKGMMLK